MGPCVMSPLERPTVKPDEKYPELARGRGWPGKLLEHHLELAKRFLSAGGAIFPLDLFMLGVANRSYFVLDAYLDAFDKWNVYAAGPLVRLQLDNLVRVSYLADTEQPHELAVRLLGDEFRHIKHTDGELLRDRKLVSLAAPRHEWLGPVYEAASGWVHMSPLHFTAPVDLDEATATLGMEFPLRYERLPVRFLAEIQGAMTQATEELFAYMELWEERKYNPLGQSDRHGEAGPE
jgi:hypothetical protein